MSSCVFFRLEKINEHRKSPFQVLHSKWACDTHCKKQDSRGCTHYADFENIWRTVDRKLNNYVNGNGVNYISVNCVRNIESSTIHNEMIEIMKISHPFF